MWIWQRLSSIYIKQNTKKKKKTFINEQNHPEKSIHLCTSPIFSESQVSIGLEESLPDCLTKRHSTSAWNKLTLEQDLAFRSTTLDSSVCLPNHQALPEKKKNNLLNNSLTCPGLCKIAGEKDATTNLSC